MSEGNGLPSGWTKAPLGSFADILGGSTPPRANPDNFGGDIVWLTPTEIPKDNVSVLADSREKLTETGFNSGGIRWIPEGSVLLTSRASIGFVAIAGTRLTTNQGFASFVLPDEFAPKFLGWWLRFQKTHLEDRAGGTTFKEISKAKLRDISAPLAPLAEQRRIVAAIEEQFTRLEAGVAALERARKGLKRYRASVLKAAVESRLTKEWREENPGAESGSALLERILQERRAKWEEAQLARYAGKEQNPPKNWRSKYKEPAAPDTADLPELPEGWRWVSTEQICDVGTGATPLRGRDEYYDGGTIPWVTSGALNSATVTHAEEYITDRALAETNVKVFPSGSLLIAMYGEGKTRGKVSELRIDAATNQACAALVFPPSSEHCRPYLKLFYLSNYLEIRRLSAGRVQPNLNLSIVKGTLVPFPPLTEQEEIVEEAERRLSVIEEVEAQIESGLKRAARLRQSILKRAFEGKLVSQDPSDEPASMLLKRIRQEREQSAARKPNRKKPLGKRPKGDQASLFSPRVD